MPYKLFLTDEADKEFTEAAEWYDEQSIGLGDRFILTVQSKLKLIEEFPERYPKRYQNFRETILSIFPYTIVYTFYKTKKKFTFLQSIIAAEIQNKNLEKTNKTV